MDEGSPLTGQFSNKIYSDVSASGQSNVHLGDIHYHSDLTQEQRCILNFKTSPYVSYKDEPNPKRAPGTCLWAFGHPHFQQWRQITGNDLLWISADPGCGKSVLSRSLVDELQAQGSISVCYLFFEDNGEQSNLDTALCAILHQLFCDQPPWCNLQYCLGNKMVSSLLKRSMPYSRSFLRLLLLQSAT